MVNSRFVAGDAYAMNRPLESMVGALGSVTPSSACVPLFEKSTSSGSPAPLLEGTTEKSSVLDVPPPGSGFTTCTGNVPAVATSWLANWDVTCVGLTGFVGRALPLTNTWLAVSIPVPDTLSVVLAAPATTVLGLRERTVGLGFTTFTGTAFDSPPPGGFPPCTGGFNMATCTVPAVTMSEAFRATTSFMPLWNEVGRLEPLTTAVEVLMKFVPFTVMVAEPTPARTVDGIMEEIWGTGAVLGVTFSVTSAEMPPPGAGVKTVTETAPGVCIIRSVGWTSVVSSVWFRKIVFGVRSGLSRGIPSNRISEFGAKPEPVTCSVNWTDPATTLDGFSELRTGTGRLMTPPHEPSASAAARRMIALNLNLRAKPISNLRCRLPRRRFARVGNQQDY